MAKLERRAAPYRYIYKDVPLEPSTICGFEGCTVELPKDDEIQSLVEDFHQVPKFNYKLTRKVIWQLICERHQELSPVEQSTPEWPLVTKFAKLADHLIGKVDDLLDTIFSDDISLVSCAGWLPFVSSIILCCEDACDYGALDRPVQLQVAPIVSCSG